MYDVTDNNGLKIVQALIRLARDGGGYLRYVMPGLENKRPASKLAYVVGIPEWEWYVGTGVYIDEIDTALAQKRAGARVAIAGHLGSTGPGRASLYGFFRFIDYFQKDREKFEYIFKLL